MLVFRDTSIMSAILQTGSLTLFWVSLDNVSDDDDDDNDDDDDDDDAYEDGGGGGGCV